MKPIELTKWINNQHKWLKIDWGCNGSLCRNKDKDCVIAYYQTDVLTYMILKVSSGFKFFRVVEFERHFMGEEVKEKEGKAYFVNLPLIIIDNDEYGNMKKELIVNAIRG